MNEKNFYVETRCSGCMRTRDITLITVKTGLPEEFNTIIQVEEGKELNYRDIALILKGMMLNNDKLFDIRTKYEIQQKLKDYIKIHYPNFDTDNIELVACAEKRTFLLSIKKELKNDLPKRH